MNETTITKGQGDDEVGGSNAANLEVDQGEDEGGEGESGQTQRSWVGELAVGDGLVETGLELTTEGGQTRRLVGVGVEEGVSAIIVCADLVAGGGAGAVVDGVDGGTFVVDHGVNLSCGHFGGWLVCSRVVVGVLTKGIKKKV